MLRKMGKRLEALRLNDQLQNSDNTLNKSLNVSTSFYGSAVATMFILELSIASLMQCTHIGGHPPQTSSHQALWIAPLCALYAKFSNDKAPTTIFRNKKSKIGSLMPELDHLDVSIVQFLHMIQQSTSNSWEELQHLASVISVHQQDLLSSLELLRHQIRTLFTSLVDIRMKLL